MASIVVDPAMHLVGLLFGQTSTISCTSLSECTSLAQPECIRGVCFDSAQNLLAGTGAGMTEACLAEGFVASAMQSPVDPVALRACSGLIADYARARNLTCGNL